MKYIVFDLDDTLLNDQRVVTPYTLNTLKRLQAQGHKLVINTARSKAFSQDYFELIRPDYAILNGGALIIDQDEKVVFRAEIDIQTTQAVVDDLLKVTENFSVQTEEILYSNNGSYTGQNAQPFDFSKEKFSLPALKIVASVEEEPAAKAIAEKYGLEFTSYFGGAFRRYNHIGATKAQGNANLVRLLGGSLADVIAFGDDLGDLEMLQQAGVGVLMRNAKLHLHGKSRYLSQYTNNEDGVARFLETYFDI